MTKENMEFRLEARNANIPLWKIALEVGISEATINRWLRVPLSGERERALRSAIKRIVEAKR